MGQKICTSIDQSKRLLELGLSSETADMYYEYVIPKSDKIIHVPKIGSPIEALRMFNMGYTACGNRPIKLEENCIPAWSLTALLKVIGDYTLQSTSNHTCFIGYDGNDMPGLLSDEHDEPINAAVEIIELIYKQSQL